MNHLGRRGGAAIAATLLLAACDGVAASGDAVTVSPLHALLTIDQLANPGFTVYQAPHSESAAQLAGSGSVTGLAGDGFQSAAAVRYTRQDEFSVASGPLDVTATAERFSTAAGAQAWLGADIATLDAGSGATPISTGPLGDAAHAVQLTRSLPDGLSAVQYTVEWRVADMLNVIVIRGRSGGTTLQDALQLAYAQSSNEPVSTPAA